MSLEAISGRRSASPAGSGRSSPVPRATRRDGEIVTHLHQAPYKADKTIRRYAATIERALSSWEISPEEWADYIAFLGRLLKAIQACPKDTHVLPHSGEIATRLAQCLNPALPSGVHQKALEVYSFVFTTFGREYTSDHLSELLPGLCAVLAFASLSVRPALYTLFEDHIIELPPSILRNALKSIILSLLPALEEESSEDFERAFNIIQRLQTAFLPKSLDDEPAREVDGYFWQCLFLAVITSPSRRQGALNYLSRKLPSLVPQPQSLAKGERTLLLAAECVVSPEPGLLLRSFVSGLSDPQVLIQRGFLDLLVAVLPLHSSILQDRVGSEDLDRLMSATTLILLRKDMSLNRRLWSWLLGPDPKDRSGDDQAPSQSSDGKDSRAAPANSQLRYFSTYGKASLQRCVLQMLQNTSSKPSQKARPFRVCLSLMDRWEIGGSLVSEVFLPAMRSLYDYSLQAASESVAEVVRSASLFFDGVEASLIWERLLSILQDGLDSRKSPATALALFKWIISSFNIKDEEMVNIHIPVALSYLLSFENATQLTTKEKLHILDITEFLLNLLPLRGSGETNGTSSQQGVTSEDKQSDAAIRSAVKAFYQAQEQSDEKSRPPITTSTVWTLCFSRLVAALNTAIAEQGTEMFTRVAGLLVVVLSKTNGPSSDQRSLLRPALLNTMNLASGTTGVLPFAVLGSLVSLSIALGGTQSDQDVLSQTDLHGIEPALTSHLWNHMSPSRPRYHVEAVRAFWQLEASLGHADGLVVSLAGLVGTAFTQSMVSENDRVESFRRFATLWTHTITSNSAKSGSSRRGSTMSSMSDVEQASRYLQVLEQPLMLSLDVLGNPTDPAFEVVKSWLSNLSSLEHVLQLLLHRLASLLADPRISKSEGRHSDNRDHLGWLQELEYTLCQVQHLLAHSSPWTWRCLGNVTIPAVPGIEEQDGLSFLAHLCSRRLFSELESCEAVDDRFIAILDAVLNGPVAIELRRIELEDTLLERLTVCISSDRSTLQGKLLRLVILALKQRAAHSAAEHSVEGDPRPSLSVKRPSVASPRLPASGSQLVLGQSPPSQLIRCLQTGFTSSQARNYLDQWLVLLAESLSAFSDALIIHLLPLVECFCGELEKLHGSLIQLSEGVDVACPVAPEGPISIYLEGLEMMLDRAYDFLLGESAAEAVSRSNEQPTSFLSNVASGVFKIEPGPSRSTRTNSRLTIILAFQDTIRIALKMWLWASRATDHSKADASNSATTAYSAQKIRNKTRHLQEQIFAVEPLEGLEVVITQWCTASEEIEASTALRVLHVMQVTRPKNVVPAILDALCSRTNPTALPASRLSSQTVDLTASDVAMFFSAYIDATEDDAMDELWPDCTTFLRDVLANPLPYRQVLPHLLSIVLLLTEKLNNTNFGEQRKMRRDLGDIFQRLLAATFTTLPSGYVAEAHDGDKDLIPSRHAQIEKTMSLIRVLNRVVDGLELILETPERMALAISTISSSLIAPTFRAKSFPRNVTQDLLTLLSKLARKVPASKVWKKDIADAFNDPKLLASTPDMVASGWYPVLHQWALHDKERMPELLSRLTPPTSAGIMFGVGASAARLDADRKTQLNLRRICLLFLSSPTDIFGMHLKTIDEKLAELFDASSSSSPSTNVQAELFMLCRALALSTSPMHLAPLWPVINDKLQSALTTLLPNSSHSREVNNLVLFQACKLLDLLVVLSPDEFQLHEWLYITDTIDAVYRPAQWAPSALADELAELLRPADDGASVPPTPSANILTGQRRLLLNDDLAVDKADIKALPKDEFISAVLRPFFRQLSIHAYEGVYSMHVPDVASLRENLLVDLLDLRTIVE